MSRSIIIDAGHGGSDSGASGNGYLEKDLCLRMSVYQYEQLKKMGVKVALTRDGDWDPGYQSRAAQVKGRYDFCLSNHFNAFNGQARGVEAIHSVHDSPEFAKKLAKTVAQTAQIPYRRTFSKELVKGTDYYFMHRLTRPTPTIILEYGFIDSVEDMTVYKYDTHFYRVADAVVEVLAAYALGVPKKVAPAVSPSKGTAYRGKRLVSVHPGDLRFYARPSWKDCDVAGTMPYNYGFPTVVRKLAVADAYQYEVKNSKGATYFTTASPKYVKLI